MTLDLTSRLYVNWRNGQESVPVLNYTAGVFTPTAFATTRVELETAVRGAVNWVGLLIDGEYAAFWNDVGELSVCTITNLAPTTASPFVEFLILRDTIPQRVMTITKEGFMWCSPMSEDDLPVGAPGFQLSTSVSFDASGVTCEGPLREIDLWVDENDDYLVDENGDLIPI